METNDCVSSLNEKINVHEEEFKFFKEDSSFNIWLMSQSSFHSIQIISRFSNEHFLMLKDIRNQIETILDFITEKLLIKTITIIKMDFDNFTCNFERIPFSYSKETQPKLVEIILEAILENFQKPQR